MKVVRIHNGNQSNIHGVGLTNVISLSDFNQIPDPLSVGGDLADKPGSSIPSLFARMMFFRTAFEGTRGSQSGVYDQLISECLDLIEEIFAGAQSLEMIPFNFQQQIAKLANTGFPEHANFANILAKQQQKYMPNVNQIFLFEKNRQVIGGTSPYTLVYTSPNYSSGKPTQSLLQRGDSFREYLYKLYWAYQSVPGAMTNDNKIFFDYIKSCQQNDPNPILRGLNQAYTLAQINVDFPQIQRIINGQNMAITVDGIMFLQGKDPNKLSSDLFVMPNNKVAQFSPQETPIVLAEGPHPGLRYYDNVLWDAGFQVQQVSDGSLPGNNPYKFSTLRAVDVFEDKLVAMPFTINPKFTPIQIPISDDFAEGYFNALLPIKPCYFKFFDTTNLKQNLTVRSTNSGWVFMLSIPVCDQNQVQKGTIQLSKTYTKNDVFYLKDKVLAAGVHLGVSPFVKTNSYDVVVGVDITSQYKTVDLDFYGCGQGAPIAIAAGYPVKHPHKDSIFTSYKIQQGFDFMRLRFSGGINPIDTMGAIVIPDFASISDSPNIQAYYSIDFGTTNTHIAYCDNANGQQVERSFDLTALDRQVQYLNIVDAHNGDDQETWKAREFYPNTACNGYNFPFRTAVWQGNSGLSMQSKLFADGAIGFQYTKEVLNKTEYKTDVKWNFLNQINAQATGEVRIFFFEICCLIKNHWLSDSSVDHNLPPVVVFTYPRSNGNFSMSAWQDAYESVFGINKVSQIQQNIIQMMPESLAPCISILDDPNTNKTQGILNIDIGGGTTDIQYYKENAGAPETSYYSSILFAGDDLWGGPCENMKNATKWDSVNNFTKLAKNLFNAADILLNGKSVKFDQIKLVGKELVNCLFRDQQNLWLNRLCGQTNGDNDLERCRLQIFMHFSGIIFHVCQWMEANKLPVPARVSFSGMGSKYLDMMFVNDFNNKGKTDFVKKLMSEYLVDHSLPQNFCVITNTTPKNITAEGAVRKVMTNKEVVDPTVGLCNGFGNAEKVLVNNLLNKEHINDLEKELEKFLTGYANVARALHSQMSNVPLMKDETKGIFIADAITSFQNIAQDSINQNSDVNKEMEESAFVWSLKNSLWRLRDE